MGVLNSIVDWVVAFFTGFFGNVVAHDFCEVAPMISSRIIHFAASRLPPSIRKRYHEEWSADLQQQPGTVAKLKWSFGCVWSANKMRREAVIDYHRRLSARFVLPSGETVTANMPTVALVKTFARASLACRRLHLPHVVVVPMFIFGIIPFSRHQWRKVGEPDPGKALHVLSSGLPWKVIKCFDGVAVDEREFGPSTDNT